MPYTTRLARLRVLRDRVEAEIRAELVRQRDSAAEPRPPAHVVREWARSVGHEVAERGSVSQALYDDYREAHE